MADERYEVGWRRLLIIAATIVVVMGDNGPMKQDLPASGYTDWIFRGTKGSPLEGGHRFIHPVLFLDRQLGQGQIGGGKLDEGQRHHKAHDTQQQ